MNEASASRLTRRQALLLGTGLAAGAVLYDTGTAAAAVPVNGPTAWTGTTSSNHWPVIDRATRFRVEGAAGVEVPLLHGDVATVLLYIARRFAYEVDMLRPGDLTGHTTRRGIGAAFESNYLSGTAIAVRPLFYPLGAQAGTGMTGQELVVIQDILADCGEVVAWGGDFSPVKESHFQIDVPPGDRRLGDLAGTINGWNETPGQGAGTIDAFAPDRIRRARKAQKARSTR